ncbi:Uncharacterised protein [Streptococcus pneumoniae]|nr:Uncharacterised protein [Streptococcus pneumoniae]
MGVNLDNILTSEGLWRLHSPNHNLVHDFTSQRINNVTVVESVAGNLVQVFSFKNLLRNSKTVCSAQADNTNSPFT